MWQIRGGKRAPEIDAGDIAVVHPDAQRARAAFQERLASARTASLAASASPTAELSEGDEIVLIGDGNPDADQEQYERLASLPEPRPDDAPWVGPDATRNSG